MKKPKTNRVLFLAALMALATACKKDPTPEPTPTNMHKKIVLIWDWYYDGRAPNRDTVKYYANRPDVDSVIMVPDSTSELSNNVASVYTTWHYHRARDTLQKCINFAPKKVKGGGSIKVSKKNGAQLPPEYDVGLTQEGMSLEDSIWYTANGWKVSRAK